MYFLLLLSSSAGWELSQANCCSFSCQTAIAERQPEAWREQAHRALFQCRHVSGFFLVIRGWNQMGVFLFFYFFYNFVQASTQITLNSASLSHLPPLTQYSAATLVHVIIQERYSELAANRWRECEGDGDRQIAPKLLSYSGWLLKSSTGTE